MLSLPYCRAAAEEVPVSGRQHGCGPKVRKLAVFSMRCHQFTLCAVHRLSRAASADLTAEVELSPAEQAHAFVDSVSANLAAVLRDLKRLSKPGHVNESSLKSCVFPALSFVLGDDESRDVNTAMGQMSTALSARQAALKATISVLSGSSDDEVAQIVLWHLGVVLNNTKLSALWGTPHAGHDTRQSQVRARSTSMDESRFLSLAWRLYAGGGSCAVCARHCGQVAGQRPLGNVQCVSQDAAVGPCCDQCKSRIRGRRGAADS